MAAAREERGGNLIRANKEAARARHCCCTAIINLACRPAFAVLFVLYRDDDDGGDGGGDGGAFLSPCEGLDKRERSGRLTAAVPVAAAVVQQLSVSS